MRRVYPVESADHPHFVYSSSPRCVGAVSALTVREVFGEINVQEAARLDALRVVTGRLIRVEPSLQRRSWLLKLLDYLLNFGLGVECDSVFAR